jgi:hypothetical protein
MGSEQALAVIARPEVLDTASLTDLAVVINREHGLALEAGNTMIGHAIRAGEALLAAKQLIRRGEWEDWLAENFVGRSIISAQQYMRIARHKHVVLEAQATNMKGALRVLHGGRDSRIDPVQEAEVLRLRAKGLTYQAIAEQLDIPPSRVAKWCNPKAEQRRLRRAHARTIAGRRALNRQKRDALVKRAGGQVAEAYALIRRALKALERAAEVEPDRDAKRAIQNATNRLYGAEDEIVAAIGTTRQ